MVVPVDDKAPDVVFMGLEGGGIAVSQVSPQLCLHSGHHLQGVEGLCDVIVRSNGKPHDFISIVCFCCEHDDGVIVFLPDFPADLEAVHIREHDVQDCQVQGCMRDAVQGLRACVEFVDGVAVAYEVQLQDVGQLLFIVHYQNIDAHFYTSLPALGGRTNQNLEMMQFCRHYTKDLGMISSFCMWIFLRFPYRGMKTAVISVSASNPALCQGTAPRTPLCRKSAACGPCAIWWASGAGRPAASRRLSPRRRISAPQRICLS